MPQRRSRERRARSRSRDRDRRPRSRDRRDERRRSRSRGRDNRRRRSGSRTRRSRSRSSNSTREGKKLPLAGFDQASITAAATAAAAALLLNPPPPVEEAPPPPPDTSAAASRWDEGASRWDKTDEPAAPAPPQDYGSSSVQAFLAALSPVGPSPCGPGGSVGGWLANQLPSTQPSGGWLGPGAAVAKPKPKPVDPPPSYPGMPGLTAGALASATGTGIFPPRPVRRETAQAAADGDPVAIFVCQHGCDYSSEMALRNLPVEAQCKVLNEGPPLKASNPSAVLMSRIRRAQLGQSIIPHTF